MEIKPIRTELDYEACLRQIEQLLDASPGTPDSDRLEVLVTLAAAYEEKHFPIPAPDDPVEVLQYYMESRGLTRSDLARYLGGRSRVSEVINRKRRLTMSMVQRLHYGLGIPADLLIGPAPAERIFA